MTIENLWLNKQKIVDFCIDQFYIVAKRSLQNSSYVAEFSISIVLYYLIDCEIKNIRVKNINFHGNFILTSFEDRYIISGDVLCSINSLRAENAKLNSICSEEN